MADAQHAPVAGGGGDEPVALGGGDGHGLLEQHVLAGLERGHADLGVQVVRRDDVDGLDGRVAQQLAVVAVDGDAGQVAAGGGGAGLAATGYASQRQPRRVANRRGVMPAPGAIADETEAHARHFSFTRTSS